MSIRFDFSATHAVVTGGTRGIGAAVSSAFLAAGARVTAVYAGDAAAAAAFAAACPAPDRLDAVRLDVADADACQAFWRELETRDHDIQVLVNSAGIRRDNVLAMMPSEDWRRVLDTNLTGVFNMCKFGVQTMSSRRYGRIVNLTSPSGKHGFEGQANYAASKAGMVALTRSLSKEVAKRGITVNCVSPGFIDTDLIRDLPAEQAKQYKQSVPVKRFGKPEEVADAVLFLAAQESSYITGSVLEVTGGL